MANPQEELRRARAKEDYYRLPNIQRKRNPNALYEWYIERFQADPADKPNIPTTNRATVYKWHKEDNWDEYCKLRELEIIADSGAAYDEYRKRGYDRINKSIPDVVDRLIALATAKSGVPPKEAISAAIALLDRVGMTAAAAVKDTRHSVGVDKNEATGVAAPDLEASDADLIKYLVASQQEESRG
jgi:hypothetical protein